MRPSSRVASKTPWASDSAPVETRGPPMTFWTLAKPLACCKPLRLVRMGLKK
jgi:hypothetical protein